MNVKISNKKIIIFDLDGVILDSIGFLREYMKTKYEGMTEEDFREIFLNNFWDGLLSFKQVAEKKYIIHEEYSKYKKIDHAKVFLFPGVAEMIENLSKKYILVINSSSDMQDILQRLAHNNILHFFDYIAGKEVSENKTEKFKLILEKYNATSDEIIFITDTIGDVIESDKADIDSVAVTWGVHSRNDFEKQKFDKLIFISDTVGDFSQLF